MFTSPEEPKPNHPYKSRQPEVCRHTTKHLPSTKIKPSRRLPSNKIKPSRHLPSIKTKQCLHLPRNQNQTIRIKVASRKCVGTQPNISRVTKSNHLDISRVTKSNHLDISRVSKPNNVYISRGTKTKPSLHLPSKHL